MEPGDQHGPFFDNEHLWELFGYLAIGQERVGFVCLVGFVLFCFVLFLEEGN